MKVVQVKCPHCSNPLMMKQKDQLLFCETCKTMHIRDGGVHLIDYEIADFGRGAALDRVYVPFWRMYSSFIIKHIESEGGSYSKLAGWVTGKQDGSASGDIFVFVPAAEFDPATFKRLAVMFTVQTPRYNSRLDFGGVPRLPAGVKKEEAMELADFVVVTMEAEKPGVLQHLDYELTVHDARVIYLPFVTTVNGLMPGF